MIPRIFKKKKSYVKAFLDNTPEDMQIRFVGSSGSSSISEAEKFLDRLFKVNGDLPAAFIGPDSRVLDFGAGLGRFSAVLLDQGLKAENLCLVDTLDTALMQLKKVFRKSEISKVGPELEKFTTARTSNFTGVFAYSIFSHLPPELASITIRSAHSMLKNNGFFVFTFWDPDILPVMRRIGLQSSNNVWAEQFANTFGSYTLDEINRSGIVYSASGGGEGLSSDVYGDTIMTHAYISELLEVLGFSKVSIIPSGEATLQAVVIAQKI